MTTRLIDWQNQPPAECRRGVVTIGNFDGVHRGHRALLDTTRRLAKELDAPAIAVTFDPPPLQLLAPERLPPQLTTILQRIDWLARNGADEVLVLHTTFEMLELTAEQFFQQVLIDRLAVRGLVEGYNFRFGRGRLGSVETLRQLCAEAGVAFIEVPALQWNGEVPSSSRIRELLNLGQIRQANDLLGRRYCVQGQIVVGARRGRTLGFPTANLTQVETLLPADGVYAVVARLGQDAWPAAAHIGPNPTFGDQARKIEVHLIGFQGDIYGRLLRVEFVDFLRGIRRFSGADELMAQLRDDIELARRLVGPVDLQSE